MLDIDKRKNGAPVAKRILIADDERLIVATLASGLEQAGYAVLTTRSGKEAIRLCESEMPDLAILDIRIPDVSGLEAARCIRERTEVPFIFLSAYGDGATVNQAVEEGALGYLLKPVDIPQLLPTVESALARAKELRELRKKERELHAGIVAGRVISVAVGLIMERYHVTEEIAFDVMRAEARSRRRKVHELATGIAQAFDTLAILGERAFKLRGRQDG